jgi:hypothetical protein
MIKSFQALLRRPHSITSQLAPSTAAPQRVWKRGSCERTSCCSKKWADGQFISRAGPSEDVVTKAPELAADADSLMIWC